MTPAHIAALLEPFLKATASPATRTKTSLPESANADNEPAGLSPMQLQNISTYIDLLLRWNARINLTAIRDPEEIVTRHFGESFFAARVLFPMERGMGCRGRTLPCTVADIGSGAGFPGLPIKLWAHDVSLTLIESNHKKAAFLREVTRALTLTDVNVQTARAETLAGTSFDVVTLRAVERFLSILPAAANLVAPSGRLALLVGAGQLDQAKASLPDFSWSHPIQIPLSTSRVVIMARRS